MSIIVSGGERSENHPWYPWFTLTRDYTEDEVFTNIKYIKEKEKKNFLLNFAKLESEGEIPEELVLILSYITKLTNINLHEIEGGEIDMVISYDQAINEQRNIWLTVKSDSSVVEFLENL